MRFVPLAALALLAVPLAAQAPSPGQPGVLDPQRVLAGTYTVDTNHTMVTWSVNHMNISLLQGQIGATGGSLTIDPRNPNGAKLEVLFQLDQLNTTSTHFTEHLKSKDYFEVATYPTARFVSTSVSWQGTSGTITGNLTIKNMTKPVTLQARLIGAGKNANSGKLNFGIRATGSVNRTDFGLGLAMPIVSNNVDLVIDASFLGAAAT